MPRAEAGTTKHLNNQLKSKGLQKLRFFCQTCQKQCRDANGFKCHTQSESHVRQILLVGEDPRKHIETYSAQFFRDFTTLLRTSHGEKQVHLNHFYQQYIADKQHVHMNATKWPSLTEFAKYLGREGICRVEETDKGLHVAWIDNSPEALRRQIHIRRKERQKGGEEQEQEEIQEQIERARLKAGEVASEEVVAAGKDASSLLQADHRPVKLDLPSNSQIEQYQLKRNAGELVPGVQVTRLEPAASATPPASSKTTFSQRKNVFAALKRAHAGRNPILKPPPRLTEQERIMLEEKGRLNSGEDSRTKRQKFS